MSVRTMNMTDKYCGSDVAILAQVNFKQGV